MLRLRRLGMRQGGGLRRARRARLMVASLLARGARARRAVRRARAQAWRGPGVRRFADWD